MRKSLVAVFILAFLISVSGCATAPKPGPRFSSVINPKPGYSVLYLYRPYHQIGMTVWPEVFINDLKTVSLINEGFSFVYLRPGKYRIRTKKSTFTTGLGNNITADIVIDSETVLFLKYDRKFREYWRTGTAGRKVVPVKDFEVIYEKWTLMGKDEALPEIEKCKYVEPYIKSFP